MSALDMSSRMVAPLPLPLLCEEDAMARCWQRRREKRAKLALEV
jgi:hypothetical protein